MRIDEVMTSTAPPGADSRGACQHRPRHPLRSRSQVRSGPEPAYTAGTNTLLWADNFNTITSSSPVGSLLSGVLSVLDSTLLKNYITLNPKFIHADPQGGLNGTPALRMDWIPSGVCQDDSRLIERSFAPTPEELYVQYSVRYTPGFIFDWFGRSGCTGNAKKLFFLWSVSGSRFDFISENHFLGVGSDNTHPLFAQNLGTPMTDEQLADGQWHTVSPFTSARVRAPRRPMDFIYGWIDGQQKVVAQRRRLQQQRWLLRLQAPHHIQPGVAGGTE